VCSARRGASSRLAARRSAIFDPGTYARRLEEAMTGADFQPLPTKWWHFDALP